MTPGFLVARRLTAPATGRSYPLTVLASSRRTVTLAATAQTTAPGEWALFTEHGHVRLTGQRDAAPFFFPPHQAFPDLLLTGNRQPLRVLFQTLPPA